MTVANLSLFKPPSYTFSSFNKEFLQFANSTYARASVVIFQVALRNLIAVTGDGYLSSISAKHVDLYKAARLNSVRPTSVNVELRALRTILNIAVRWNMIETNPFAKMQLVKIPESMPVFFTTDDFTKVMEVVADH
jgi:site-specific recombinase XerD